MIEFNRRTGELLGAAASRRLEPKAAAVLAELQDANGELVSRRDLLERCWGSDLGSDEALTQAVAQIRRAYDELGGFQPIETLARRGYRLRTPDGTSAVSAQPNRRARPLVYVGALILAALLLVALLQPHYLRHSIRHALGLGPGQATGYPAH